MLKFIVLFLIIISPIFSWAQRYSFVEYSTARGLPQSQVTSIGQDKNGFLWVGTLGGLARFNGTQFKTYSNDDGLFNNKITFISTKNNEFWVGHEGGVSTFENNTFKNISLGPKAISAQVSSIISFQQSKIISTNGAGLFELKNQVIRAIPFNVPDGERIRDIVQYKSRFFIATRSGIYHTVDFKKFEILPNTEELSISDLKIKNDQLYACAYQDGLFRIQLDSYKLKSIDIPKEFAPRGLEITKDGSLWASSNNGILVLKKGKWETVNNENGLPIGDIRCVYQDDEHNIWLGSLGKGLIYFPGDLFVYFNTTSGLTSDLILNFNQHKNGSYVIGSYDQGILSYTNQFKTISNEN
ncbi:MAG: hypothetical protein KJ941_00455, partial [Bacteroidetes bacterium]|nr:hypothetical protein [Bacteroidota bacterium]